MGGHCRNMLGTYSHLTLDFLASTPIQTASERAHLGQARGVVEDDGIDAGGALR